MKNKILLCVVLFAAYTFSMQAYAQSWSAGTNSLYTYPNNTKVGIGISTPSELLHINQGALKIGNSTSAEDRSINVLKFGDGNYVKIGEWEEDDQLSFKATNYNFTQGNVGIGVVGPAYKLDVNGKMFLHTVDWEPIGWARSYLQWEFHKLIMGTPTGVYGHAIIELIPGGSSQGEVFSSFSLYHAYNASEKEERLHLQTVGNSWINTSGNFGIGTDNPIAKLDVRGTIRADEIYVNTVSGADFVFDKSYNLRPLSEVQAFIQQNKHLPEIPSAAEMQEKGVNMNDLQIQLLQKVEELTLYILQQEQRIKDLENQLSK